MRPVGYTPDRMDDSIPRPFDLTLAELHGRVLKIARMMLGDPWAAEDVAQETIARAIEHVESFHGGDFFAWVCTISMNLCRAKRLTDRKRSAATDPLLLERQGLGSTRRGPATSVIFRETHERAALAMLGLPPILREAFVLHFIEDLPYEAVARILGISAVAARLRGMRARKSLQSEFLTFFEPDVRARLSSPPDVPPAQAV